MPVQAALVTNGINLCLRNRMREYVSMYLRRRCAEGIIIYKRMFHSTLGLNLASRSLVGPRFPAKNLSVASKAVGSRLHFDNFAHTTELHRWHLRSNHMSCYGRSIQDRSRAPFVLDVGELKLSPYVLVTWLTRTVLQVSIRSCERGGD